MKLDYFEVPACLAAVAVLALVTAAGDGIVAADPRAAPAAAVSLASDAAPEVADAASDRSAGDLPAPADPCRCVMRARARQSSTLRASTPPPPSSEQGIECPFDAEQDCI
jgi:hypothetical protein